MSAEGLTIVLDRLRDYVASASWTELSSLALGAIVLFNLLSPPPPRVPGAPVYGYRSKWEPSLLLRLRYVFGANEIIASGYQKLKDVPFVVRRWDTDVTVLPIKYLEETRLYAREKLTGRLPPARSLVPRWTWTGFLLDSDLHIAALKSKLNPSLNKFIEITKGELDYSWDIEVPQPDDWTETDIQKVIRNLVARTSAKVFVGYPACRNPEWLRISVEFTYDVFTAAFTLRMFPPWTHAFVAPFVPARWRLRRQLRIAKKVIGDLMRTHREAVANGIEPEDTLLDWMMENSSPKENLLPEMAGRQCILTLAAIHTTSSTVSNVLFDLCDNPEWIPVLREEVEQVTKECGYLGERDDIQAKQWLHKLEKMDSFVVESQRHNAPILLRPQRVAMESMTLKDGTHIPKGAQVGWAGHDHSNDGDVISSSNPSLFDPMRNYRRRHADGGANKNNFIAGQTDLSSLSFGYGSQACPGRYFAISQIKLILARLLIEFEFSFIPGAERPKNSYVEENVCIDPYAKLMVKRRK